MSKQRRIFFVSSESYSISVALTLTGRAALAAQTMLLHPCTMYATIESQGKPLYSLGALGINAVLMFKAKHGVLKYITNGGAATSRAPEVWKQEAS
jgi:hypothetical protein